MVHAADPSRRTQGAHAPRRWAGDPRYPHLVCSVHRIRGSRLLFLGQLGRGSLLSHLRRALWLLDRQPLARVRPSHRVQDAMDERCGLSDRLLHDHARAGDLALEPYAPPHGYDHRRPRSRDHHAASAGCCVASAQYLRAQEHGHFLSESVSARHRPTHGGGGDFRARERAIESVLRRSRFISPSTPSSSSPVSRFAPFCRRCISVCRRCTADGSRSIAA